MMIRLQSLAGSHISRYKASVSRCFSSNVDGNTNEDSKHFETVFSFPLIKYFSIFNRLKVYHLFGSAIAVPCCGLLEMLNAVPSETFISAGYIGITGGALLSLVSIPVKNVIGFLYISQDNSLIKISAVDYWGRRKDQVVRVDDWIPLLDMPAKTLDAFFLSPQLSDGTKYKLFLKFGKIHNIQKMGEVLE